MHSDKGCDMRPFLFVVIIGAAAVGYLYRGELSTTWYYWRPVSFSVTTGAQSFGNSLSHQFERFGRGVDSLSH